LFDSQRLRSESYKGKSDILNCIISLGVLLHDERGISLFLDLCLAGDTQELAKIVYDDMVISAFTTNMKALLNLQNEVSNSAYFGSSTKLDDVSKYLSSYQRFIAKGGYQLFGFDGSAQPDDSSVALAVP
jgi:hypothetical protein